MLIEFVERELCIASAVRMGNREKARVKGCGLESEDSGSRRREPIARMHHNEIAIAIEKEPTRYATRRKRDRR